MQAVFDVIFLEGVLNFNFIPSQPAFSFPGGMGGRGGLKHPTDVLRDSELFVYSFIYFIYLLINYLFLHLLIFLDYLFIYIFKFYLLSIINSK